MPHITIQPAIPKGLLSLDAVLVFLYNYGSHFLLDSLLIAAKAREKIIVWLRKKQNTEVGQN